MPVEDFEILPGSGARGIVGGHRVVVASAAYLDERGIALEDARARELVTESDATVAVVLVDDRPVGLLALADVVRDESRSAVADLAEMGIRSVMLTGDRRSVAEETARALGIDQVFAEVLPAEKSATVERARREGGTVAMVGDGVNDAPALATADVGIAIGAGTDVAVETADIVLVRSDPRAVAQTIRLARATYRKMSQNLAWAAGYNVIAIPLAAGVLSAWGIVLSPAVGAALMSVSTVIVAINARLLRLPAD
jgi:Cu2+-exporting ATPase